MSIPAVITTGKDRWSRELRFEFHSKENPGVYGLSVAEQQALLLPGHLPSMGLFLPDFAIVLGTGLLDPHSSTVAWTDVRVHVGGICWSGNGGPLRDPRSRREIGALDWYSARDLVHGRRRQREPAAPDWLLELIRERTPWGSLLDDAAVTSW